MVIATKVHGKMRPGPNGGGLSRKAILSEIDHSLRRLGVEYVDLYQIHGRADRANVLQRGRVECGASANFATAGAASVS